MSNKKYLVIIAIFLICILTSTIYLHLKYPIENLKISNGIIHHPTYGNYPEIVPFKQGMNIMPGQTAEMKITLNENLGKSQWVNISNFVKNINEKDSIEEFIKKSTKDLPLVKKSGSACILYLFMNHPSFSWYKFSEAKVLNEKNGWYIIDNYFVPERVIVWENEPSSKMKKIEKNGEKYWRSVDQDAVVINQSLTEERIGKQLHKIMEKMKEELKKEK